jgi:hypothetical protein
MLGRRTQPSLDFVDVDIENDAAMQRHDFVLILDDEDLGLLVKEAKESYIEYDKNYLDLIPPDKPEISEFRFLHEQYRRLVSLAARFRTARRTG